MKNVATLLLLAPVLLFAPSYDAARAQVPPVVPTLPICELVEPGTPTPFGCVPARQVGMWQFRTLYSHASLHMRTLPTVRIPDGRLGFSCGAGVVITATGVVDAE